MFASVLNQLLTDGLIPPHIDDLGSAVLAYTLYRYVFGHVKAPRSLRANDSMCMDAAAMQSIHRMADSASYPSIQFPGHVKQ